MSRCCAPLARRTVFLSPLPIPETERLFEASGTSMSCAVFTGFWKGVSETMAERQKDRCASESPRCSFVLVSSSMEACLDIPFKIDATPGILYF